MQDKETVTRFLESCGQFERIVNDSVLLRITRLTDEEIIGTKNSAGIIEKYFSMSQEDTTCLQDLSLGAGGNEGRGQLPLPFIRFPIRKTCRQTYPPTAGMNGFRQTEATAACPLPHR